jgi:hypothetical protein
MAAFRHYSDPHARILNLKRTAISISHFSHIKNSGSPKQNYIADARSGGAIRLHEK